MSDIRKISAHVSKPNTPESDIQRQVMHDVTFVLDGAESKISLMAECPMDAISKVRAMSPEQLRSAMKPVHA